MVLYSLVINGNIFFSKRSEISNFPTCEMMAPADYHCPDGVGQLFWDFGSVIRVAPFPNDSTHAVEQIQ